MKDTQEELDRLEEELLKDQDVDPEFLSELLKEPEPAFDDPDAIHDPEDPIVYCNYSNGYGQDAANASDYADTPGEAAEISPETVKKNDRTIMGLMIAASALCAGILGILIYWMVVFLR